MQFNYIAAVIVRSNHCHAGPLGQFRIAKRIRSGQVFINNYGAGGGVELPFGGVKSSG